MLLRTPVTCWLPAGWSVELLFRLNVILSKTSLLHSSAIISTRCRLTFLCVCLPSIFLVFLLLVFTFVFVFYFKSHTFLCFIMSASFPRLFLIFFLLVSTYFNFFKKSPFGHCPQLVLSLSILLFNAANFIQIFIYFFQLFLCFGF